MPARIAVLASGGGTNLQALLDHFNASPGAAARVELVVGSRPGIGALERAERAGVPSLVLSPAAQGERFAPALLAALDEHRVELVVLAGWLQLLPSRVVERYAGQMVNIHPALLPGFGGTGMYGQRVHRAVLASGARVSGATVHLVDAEYDRGRILAQWPVPVLPDDTSESLAARVLRVEHLLLPAAVEAMVRGAETAPAADPLAFELAPLPAPDAGSVRRLCTVAAPATDD